MRQFIATALMLFSFSNLAAQGLGDLKDLANADAAKDAGDSMGMSLDSLLGSQLGMNEDQAAGSMGSLLTLANEKLQAGDFDKLAEMIPGADGYMDKAKSLGAVSGPVGDIDGLTNSLSSLGITPEMIEKFLPMVKDYLGKLGGSDIQSILGQFL